MMMNLTTDSGAASDSSWRTAVLEVHQAQTRYLALLEADVAEDRDLELAWLALWRAEQRRDSLMGSGDGGT
ncbi:MAG TPA: hypothetical protein VE046_11765 [Steroidobacteraceae bacterium]|nr:hypothetical protein [Steroidobacteraceae bacterium]